MQRHEAIKQIRENVSFFLKKAKKDGFICPICGSGSGEHGTGITTKDGVHFRCWAGCFDKADIIDIVGLSHGIPQDGDFNQKFRVACDEFGISYDELEPDEYIPQKTAADALKTSQTDKRESDEEKAARKAFIEAAAKRRDETGYFADRGIGEATLERFNVGFCPNWKSPAAIKNGKYAAASPRAIVPNDAGGYLARATSEKTPDGYRKMKDGPNGTFNESALLSSDVVFLTEGEFDAMSVIEAGGEAVGLGGVANLEQFCRRMRQIKENGLTLPVVLLALDNDQSGQETARKAIFSLSAIGASVRVADICNGCKDPNEALTADREAFKKAVTNAIESARSGVEIEPPKTDIKPEPKQNALLTREDFDATESERVFTDYFDRYMRPQKTPDPEDDDEAERTAEYLKNAASCSLSDFAGQVPAAEFFKPIKTGFSKLDDALGGGLSPGLSVVGAISSLGKTSFCLQMADQIAKQGQDVLIVSLEMSRRELIAKSVARAIAQKVERDKLPNRLLKTARQILTRNFGLGFNLEEMAVKDDAIKEYSKVAERVFIFESVSNFTADGVRKLIEMHKAARGVVPVVILDYLQILAPIDGRMTDKQNTDSSVNRLKVASRDLNAVIVAVSSFNRESYTASASMQAFKESGSIEYSSDVLIALQLAGLGNLKKGADRDEFINSMKAKEDREIELIVLKNRFGPSGRKIDYRFLAKHDYFKEE